MTVNGLVGEGILINVSVPGCLIETEMPLIAGQFVHLRCSLGSHELRISLAAVRWINGKQAGIEFIRMSAQDQARLRWHVGFTEKRRPGSSKWSEAVMCSGFSGV
jgi:hypothetical protein